MKLYCITFDLAKFYNVQIPSSYWQLHDLLNFVTIMCVDYRQIQIQQAIYVKMNMSM